MDEFCPVKHLFVCSMMKSGGSLMCLQDVKVGKKGDNVARCMSDGGSEGTLILDSFAKAQNFKSIEATYTLGGMGGATVTYTPSTGGRIYSVTLRCTDGSTA